MKCLTTGNSYRSPARPVFWFARENPTSVFYAQICMIVFQASYFGKRGVYTPDRWIQSSLNVISGIESVGGSYDIRNIRSHAGIQSPCVFISNHMSILETFVLPCLIRPIRDVTFVVKESLTTYPFFRHVINSRNPIVVGRDNPRQDLKTVLEDGRKRLGSGMSVVIFPQTTRSLDVDPRKFNTLGIKLAARNRVPAVPVAVKTDAWGVGRRFKDFGKIDPAKTVHISFGEPITIEGPGKKEHKTVVEFIADNLNSWR
ncbi:Acyl-CoA:1-acyl-sn-glycerol-3-phosphate acyltransferase (EC [Olavius algarvensis associated proteobacterium Delta 3]|nr:Acyl-CoA:1-acyl-sn-glycerol-3-phosphate acyltransferase (EC [Olavius algarvensis associated proteobacterium Delta 3]CAB5149744.1 Acyl-CoA:1-acyl-sn-glycerol-3-phosphate acyltransferase (EC [Olavius algarvensis associated proteobacterium Delta 3]